MQFIITNTAQNQIKSAIHWLCKTGSEETAADTIKGLITDFQNQLTVMPESGKKCLHLDADNMKEMVKGQYRFVYRLDENNGEFTVTIVMFCHTRMDYTTLLSASY